MNARFNMANVMLSHFTNINKYIYQVLPDKTHKDLLLPVGIVGGHNRRGAGTGAQDQVLQLHQYRTDAVVDTGENCYAL